MITAILQPMGTDTVALCPGCLEAGKELRRKSNLELIRKEVRA
jgi:hypothetical protein